MRPVHDLDSVEDRAALMLRLIDGPDDVDENITRLITYMAQISPVTQNLGVAGMGFALAVSQVLLRWILAYDETDVDLYLVNAFLSFPPHKKEPS